MTLLSRNPAFADRYNEELAKVTEPDLDAQIKCLKREIAMRKNVYPKWVSIGRMKQADADHEIAAMTAALHTIMKLKDAA